MVPTVQPEDFSQACAFHKVLDDVQLITYMEFQKNCNDRMQRYKQKILKMPPTWVLSPICDPKRFFFKNRALSLLYPYGAPHLHAKELEKTNERSLRYLKMDQGPTNGQG